MLEEAGAETVQLLCSFSGAWWASLKYSTVTTGVIEGCKEWSLPLCQDKGWSSQLLV